ncbi:MAG: hypothetical protein QNJ14_18560 [Woeseiaceae bacterium]|nr:hypothetical protein [Woeseiaceae bacterium]
MSRLALEVSVNGEKAFTIGHTDWCMMNAVVDFARLIPENDGDDEMRAGSVSGHIFLRPRDKVGPTNALPYDALQIRRGDEVTIRVIETDSPDSPGEPTPMGHWVELDAEEP